MLENTWRKDLIKTQIPEDEYEVVDEILMQISVYIFKNYKGNDKQEKMYSIQHLILSKIEELFLAEEDVYNYDYRSMVLSHLNNNEQPNYNFYNSISKGF